MKKLFCYSFFLFFLAVNAAHTSEFQLTTFRVAQQSTFQGGSIYSGALLWNPRYRFSNEIGVGLDLGASVLKVKNTSGFIAPEYLATAALSIGAGLGVEAGAGARTWISNGGTSLLAQVNLTYALTERFLHAIDHLYAGYSFENKDPKAAHTIRIGVGLVF